MDVPSPAKSSCSIMDSITVEPILFLYGLSGSFQWPTVDALIYRKVCMGNFNSSICDNLDKAEYTSQEDIVQSQTSHWYLANNLCFEIPSIITSFFYGSLSDNFSRKTALMLPLIGQMITLAIYIINSIMMSIPIYFILIGPLLSGTFGGWISCNLASYSYLSDVSTEENRSVRIGIGESMSAISVAIGFFVSGVTLDHTGFAFVLAISFSLYTLAFLYAKFFVHDIIQDQNSPPRSPKPSCCQVVRSVCSASSVRDAFGVVFKKRDGHRRFYVIILLFGMFTGILTGSASWLIGYLFLRRQPLSWTQTLYGYWVGYGAFLHGLVLICILPMLKKCFHMKDTSILILATFLQAAAEALFGFCNVTWMVFLVPLVGFLADARPTCARALLSNLVDKNELGKVFALVGSLQSSAELIAAAIYNNAYPLTLKHWAGLCFIAGAAFTAIPVALFTWVHIDMGRTTRVDVITTTPEDEELLLSDVADTLDQELESSAEPT